MWKLHFDYSMCISYLCVKPVFFEGAEVFAGVVGEIGTFLLFLKLPTLLNVLGVVVNDGELWVSFTSIMTKKYYNNRGKKVKTYTEKFLFGFRMDTFETIILSVNMIIYSCYQAM